MSAPELKAGGPPADVDDWEPGRARRGPNFAKWEALGRAWTYDGETIGRISRAVIRGAKDLKPAQRLMLLILVESLNEAAMAEANNACVWPSSDRIYDDMGCVESYGRRIKAELEHLGYVVRRYNAANRPMYREGLDLAVLLARLPELEAAIDAAGEALQARREASWAEWGAGDETGDSPVDGSGAQAPLERRLEQSQEKRSSLYGGADAPAARGRAGAHRAPASGSSPVRDLQARAAAGIKGERCSPGRASGGRRGQIPASVRAELARQELQLAVQVSPRVARLVPQRVIDDPATASLADAEGWAAAAGELMPDARRNNGDTFRWAFRTHGARALALLALAIEDQAVEKPPNWFGGMAKTDPERLDLRPNFARLLRERGEFPREVAKYSATVDPPPRAKKSLADPERVFAAPRGVDDPTWMKVAIVLSGRVGPAAWNALFAGLGFAGVDGDVLKLVAPDDGTRRAIQRDHTRDLMKSAQAAGLKVRELRISLREKVVVADDEYEVADGDPDWGEGTDNV